jgi:DNA-binding NarL/FixJ family response regulator
MFFESLGFHVGVIAVGAGTAGQEPELVARASVTAVDVALDPWSAVELCRELAAQRPALPVVGVVCCPQALTPWSLSALLSAGVTSFVDLRARAEDVRRLLLAAARGESVLHLELARGGIGLLQDVFSGRRSRNDREVRLLELVALGLPDREIGLRLHLSPHTVKHQIEQLRGEVGVRNRTELAAWAGRNGFYIPEDHARAGAMGVAR